MNIIIDLLPTTVFIDDIEYEINSNFRVSILFEMMMQDGSISDEEKGRLALSLYYKVLPHDLGKAAEQISWFYRCGKEREVGKGGERASRAKQVYSFEYDADYIYSAFLTQYGIDLQDIDYLHWWKFKAMFTTLNDDNKISKIMGYRSIEINNDMSKSEKVYYREMKRIYKLPDSRTEQEKEDDFHNSLASII